MKWNSLTLLVSVVLLATTYSITCAAEQLDPADRELAADLKLLQGDWMMLHEKGKDGKFTIRSVKTIEGNKETVRRFNIATGKRTHEHSVEFRLSKSGDVRVMTFYAVGGSPESGASFLYKVDVEYFFDIPGLLHGSTYRNCQPSPKVWRWKRVTIDAEAKNSPVESLRSN